MSSQDICIYSLFSFCSLQEQLNWRSFDHKHDNVFATSETKKIKKSDSKHIHKQTNISNGEEMVKLQNL
jgi:hypothetical protein